MPDDQSGCTGYVQYDAPASGTAGDCGQMTEEQDTGLPAESEIPDNGSYSAGPEKAEAEKTETFHRSGFWVRFFARAIDRVLAGLLCAAALATMSASGGRWLGKEVFFRFKGWMLVCWLVFKLYHICTTCVFGASPGKRLLDLEVISTEGGETTFWQIFFRETFGKMLSAMSLGIGYMMVLEEKGTLHDRLADTAVVYSFRKNKAADAGKR